MPTRPGKKLKAEARIFTTSKAIKSLARKNFTNIDLQVGALNTKLENLERLVQKYTTPVNGEYPVLSEADKIELSKAYSQAIVQCEHLLAFQNNQELKNNLSYKAIAKMAEKTRKFLTSDLKALTALNASVGATLPEALENARTAVINLDTSNVKIAKGGCMSSRIPLSISTKDGHKIEGMFTKTTSYDYASKSNALFQKLMDMTASNITKEFFRGFLLSNDDVTNNTRKFSRTYSFYASLLEHPKKYESAFALLGDANFLDNREFTYQEVSNIKKFLISKDFMTEALNLYKEHFMNTEKLSIEGGANIDKRNTAMSIVANLFGRSDLLANSVSMTIGTGQEKQTGTFMEFVKGASDLAHLKKDDPFFDCEIATGIDRRPVLKDMADLQVIDYICGNVDRHTGNMLYVFDQDEYGDTYLKGIKAIDNDASFGRRDLSNGLQRLSNVAGMKVISSSMANLVRKITPATLKLSLKGTGLSDAAINEAVARLRDVKQGINNQTLEVVDDNEWKDFTLNDLKKTDEAMEAHGHGVFSLLAKQFDEDHRAEKFKATQASNADTGIKLANAEMKNNGKGYELNDAEQIKARDGINTVVQELDAVSKVWFGSTKYKNMLASAKALQKELATWEKKSQETGKTVWDAAKFEKMTNDLRTKTELYLDRKYNQSASKANRDNSIKRMLAASAAMDYTHKFIDKVELSAWDEYRQNNAEYNMGEYTKQRQEQKNIDNKQVGQVGLVH